LTIVAPGPAQLNPEAAGANHVARGKRLGLGMLTAYGSGALVQDTAVYSLNSLLLFYLTIVCGMSGSAAGLALGVALVVDSVVDPLVGSLSDNSRSRHGRRHPYMLFSAIPLVVALGLLFSIPAGLSGGALFAYALSLLLLVRICISLFQVPYIALGAELSDDYAERSTIVAGRVLFGVIANAAAIYLAYGVFLKGPGGQTHRDAYGPMAWSVGAVVLAGAALATFGTLSARHRLHAAAPGQGAAMGRFFSEVAEVFRNPSFRILFTACLVVFISMGVAAALTLHANTYFWKLSTQAILVISLIAVVGLFFGVFIAGALAKVLEKRVTSLIGVGLVALSQLVPVILRVSGLTPPGTEVLVLSIAAVVFGVGVSFAVIGFQSMMADAADEHEHLFGARREGLYFAGISLAAKASSGLGALIAGVVLDAIGFPHGLDAQGLSKAVAISPGAVTSLGVAYGPGAAVITGLGMVILMAYRRGKADHEVVREALDRRREGGGRPD
jgi:GPH family glycoside/pentoside/hexuronide:cation symporter